MDEITKYALYFVLGGLTLVGTNWASESGNGRLAAFIATLPIFTIVVTLLVYYNGGPEVCKNYLMGMVWFTPAWLLCIAALWYCTIANWNPWFGSAIGVGLYTLASWITIKLI